MEPNMFSFFVLFFAKIKTKIMKRIFPKSKKIRERKLKQRDCTTK